MTMSPAGVAPNVPVVAPDPICSASARALAGSRLTTSTVCPALAVRPTIAAAMPPEQMMQIVLMHDSSVELDQVLKDQLTPAISARLHKQSTFQKPAKFDRRETEIFRKRTNLRCCAVIVARQEHDSPATMNGRVLGKDRGGQMIEALNQPSAREGLRDELGRR